MVLLKRVRALMISSTAVRLPFFLPRQFQVRQPPLLGSFSNLVPVTCVISLGVSPRFFPDPFVFRRARIIKAQIIWWNHATTLMPVSPTVNSVINKRNTNRYKERILNHLQVDG